MSEHEHEHENQTPDAGDIPMACATCGAVFAWRVNAGEDLDGRCVACQRNHQAESETA
jgi:hypothetical protein